jgi:hypothetical protein
MFAKNGIRCIHLRGLGNEPRASHLIKHTLYHSTITQPIICIDFEILFTLIDFLEI